MGLYTGISLFSGYGGFELGLRLAGLDIATVCYVENDAYCQQIIKARIQDGWLDDAPIWDDITTFDGRPWRGHVDFMSGGFPCQPHSVAGKRAGADDSRNLWPDTLRVIREVGPRIVLLENVPGILANGYGGTVVGELSAIGYDCVWHCVPAAAVGAPHLRWRWWCLAYAESSRCEPSGDTHSQRARDASENQPGRNGRCWATIGSNGQVGDVADAERGESWEQTERKGGEDTGGRSEALADAEGESGALRPAEGERPGRLAGGGDDVEDAGRLPTGRPARPGETEGGRPLGEPSGSGGEVADAAEQLGDGSHDNGSGRRRKVSEPGDSIEETRPLGSWWAVEPGMGRVANGVAHRVDRLKACGNGIVPAVVAFVWQKLTEGE